MGKRAAAKEPCEPRRVKTDTMDKVAVSKMLGQLKYNSGASSKASEEFKSQSAALLSKYQGADAPGKHELLKKWKLNNRDLSWAMVATDESRQTDSSSGTQSGYFDAHQILSMNGLYSDSYTASTATVTSTRIVRWYYVSTKAMEANETKERIKSQKETLGFDMKKLQPRTSNAVEVKAENPDFLKFGQRLVVLRSAKSSLSRSLDMLEDLNAFVSRSAQHVQDRCADVSLAITHGSAFLAELRVKLVGFDQLGASNDIDGPAAEVETLIATASGHVDGAKVLMKRIRTILAAK